MTTSESAIELRIDPRRRPVGSGYVQRLLPFRKRRMVGPFIFVDHMGPDALEPGASVNVDAHPHIGLATVTYLFEGRLVHRDSTGANQTIEPGAINWMTAGSGVSHTERSHPDDVDTQRTLHGLQTWVALPDDTEEAEPSFEHLGTDAVPVDRRPGGTVRVAVGSGWGIESPVVGSSPLVLAQAELDGSGELPIDTGHRELAVVALGGGLAINDEALVEGQMAVLRSDVASRLSGRGTAIVLGGDPVGKRYIWWNFVGSDQERIEQAKSDWEAQRFPTVPGDHDPWVPLPS